LRQSENVLHVPVEEEHEGSPPSSSHMQTMGVQNGFKTRDHILGVVSELRLLVALVEVLDLLLVGLNGGQLLGEESIGILGFSLFFMCFQTHDTHEEVSWVGGIWTGEVDVGEVVNSIDGLVEVDDLAKTHEHETVKGVEDFGAWLMDSTHNSST
jgi:hypothetical protein